MGRLNQHEKERDMGRLNQHESMGRANQQSSVLQHFSHSHPLHLTHVQQSNQIQCWACKLPCSTSVYGCSQCNFFLHKACAQLPRQIQHPSHPSHPLSLLATPDYPDVSFSCDACGLSGTAFSYHCASCQFDLHTLCTARPLHVHHQSHPHPLFLTFAPPYGAIPFSCDICRLIGGQHWLYRCTTCGFDAHLGCAASNPQPLSSHPRNQSYYVPHEGMQVQPSRAQNSTPIAQPDIVDLIVQSQTAATASATNQLMSFYTAQSRMYDGILRSSMARPQITFPVYTPIPPPAPTATATRPNSNNGWETSLLQSLAQFSLNNNNSSGNAQTQGSWQGENVISDNWGDTVGEGNGSDWSSQMGSYDSDPTATYPF